LNSYEKGQTRNGTERLNVEEVICIMMVQPYKQRERRTIGLGNSRRVEGEKLLNTGREKEKRYYLDTITTIAKAMGSVRGL